MRALGITVVLVATLGLGEWRCAEVTEIMLYRLYTVLFVMTSKPSVAMVHFISGVDCKAR